MDIVALLTGPATLTRAILRAPLVHLRLLVETPAIWAPALGAGLLIALAWQQDRRDRIVDARQLRLTEAFACAFGMAMWVWFFHAGQFPWAEGDWREEWTFFLAWREALQGGGLPYYLATAMQGTERYFANLQTPMMPYVFGLALVSLNVFVLFHMAFVYGIGFVGAVVLRRELELRLMPWTLFVLIFTLNGHIISHLSAGHLPWAAYFLTPWLLLSAVRIARDDRSMRNVATCAATLAGMILIGGWHVFIWSLLFMIFTCLVSLRRLTVLAQIGVITGLLAAARLAPAVVTFGTGFNIFMSGYPGAASLFAALVDTPLRDALLDQWELDAYVGYGGFLLLCLGMVPFHESAKRSMNVLLLPSAALIVLSLGHVYGQTLFRLPGFVSERVTTRLIVLPILWLTIAGAMRFDAWWRRARLSYAWSIPALLGAWFVALQLLLRAQTWRPHAGTASEGLPAEVLKTVAVEPLYFWASWCGVAISVAAAVAVARLLLSPRSIHAA